MERFRTTLALVTALSMATAWATPIFGHADKTTYHQDRQRSGWNAAETMLTPQSVASGRFGQIWQSPPLDGFGAVPPRLFASPLYLGSVAITAGPGKGRTLSVAYVVTTTGYTYAINARATSGLAAGAILWRARLTDKPCDGGTGGNLSTPVIDRAANRLYVTSCDSDRAWRVHAINLRNGDQLPGWPVALDAATLNRPGMNRNGEHQFSTTRTIIQRGALNLSADGSRLFVALGPDSAGWLVAVDTRRASVASAFSSTALTGEDQGGMWASGGPAVDDAGLITIATGSKFLARARKGVAGIYPDSDHDWGQSVLQFRDDRAAGLTLLATYSPFNFCQAGAADIDLGSSGTVAVDLASTIGTTPHLLLVGGKQGNLYLLDRDHLPGGTVKRHACSTDPDTDGSLLAPEPQLQFGLRGPLNLFGPYSDYVSMLDQAKSRSTPAVYRDATGDLFVLATGSTKTGDDFATSVPPGLARVAIVAPPGKSAYLRLDRLEKTQTLLNPGSPVVSSAGGSGVIVWVLDPNAPRSAPLYGDAAPRPVLYAFDAATLALLWRSPAGVLQTSGKYNEPTVVDGMVLVGTDRLQAFGFRAGAGQPPSIIHAARPSATRLAPSPATMPVAGGPASGRIIFQARRAACHESRQPGTPSRADLSKLPSAQIVDILLHGVMRPMAAGLSDSDAQSVATYVTTGK